MRTNGEMQQVPLYEDYIFNIIFLCLQIVDWVCMLLDTHFTVLVMTPEAKGSLLNLHSFVRSQVINSFCP